MLVLILKSYFIINLQNVLVQSLVKLKEKLLNSAININDLCSPPGNNLKSLKGDRVDQHSIRINDQWRICFTRHDGNAHNVEIVDYH
ncbi:plasmid maintenance system killer family protein [Rickettsia endosymbiont of Ixodes pacificus]|nr:plasmid maintenance system killer family protein [Rickettsia endosymbiont of Ixodes pacificus]